MQLGVTVDKSLALPIVRFRDGEEVNLYEIERRQVNDPKSPVSSIRVPHASMIGDAIVELLAQGYLRDHPDRSARFIPQTDLYLFKVPIDLCQLGLRQTRTVYKHGSWVVQFFMKGSRRYNDHECNEFIKAYRSRIQTKTTNPQLMVLTQSERCRTDTAYEVEKRVDARYGSGTESVQSRAVKEALTRTLGVVGRVLDRYNQSHPIHFVPPGPVVREISLANDRYHGKTIGGRSTASEILIAVVRTNGTLFSDLILVFRMLHEVVHEQFDGHFADFFQALRVLFNIAAEEFPATVPQTWEKLFRTLQNIHVGSHVDVQEVLDRNDYEDLMTQYDVRKLLLVYHVQDQLLQTS